MYMASTRKAWINQSRSSTLRRSTTATPWRKNAFTTCVLPRRLVATASHRHPCRACSILLQSEWLSPCRLAPATQLSKPRLSRSSTAQRKHNDDLSVCSSPFSCLRDCVQHFTAMFRVAEWYGTNFPIMTSTIPLIFSPSVSGNLFSRSPHRRLYRSCSALACAQHLVFFDRA